MKDFKVSDKLQQQLNAFHSRPIVVGDIVLVYKANIKPYTTSYAFGGNSTNEVELVSYPVVDVNGDKITISSDKSRKVEKVVIPISIVEKVQDRKVGVNPLKSGMPDVNFYSVDIWQLLSRAGYEVDGSQNKDRDYEIEGVVVPRINWNPFVLEKNGDKQYFQRDFIWTLEDKQLLVESVYNEIGIGTFIVRKRGWSELEKLIKNGHKDVAFYEIVDGKQRLNALIEFISGNFCDFQGNYFPDFSYEAKDNFVNYRRLSFGELGENTPDKDVIKIFLNINFAGKPMSSDHLDFVKSINI